VKTLDSGRVHTTKTREDQSPGDEGDEKEASPPDQKKMPRKK
jgi:hypothetical protein